jgi:hypothetical protein
MIIYVEREVGSSLNFLMGFVRDSPHSILLGFSQTYIRLTLYEDDIKTKTK